MVGLFHRGVATFSEKRRARTFMERGRFFGGIRKNPGWDSGCPRSRGQLRVRLESRLRGGNDGPRVSVTRNRFFVAETLQNVTSMKPLIRKLTNRPPLRRPAHNFWIQCEFQFPSVTARQIPSITRVIIGRCTCLLSCTAYSNGQCTHQECRRHIRGDCQPDKARVL